MSLHDFLRKMSFERMGFFTLARKMEILSRFESFCIMGALFLGIFGAALLRYEKDLKLVWDFGASWDEKDGGLME